MLRFNCAFSAALAGQLEISIHLMLRFNIVGVIGGFFFLSISIHLMLRFNFFALFHVQIGQKFQYILCYGSTYFPSSVDFKILLFQYILCYGSTNLCSQQIQIVPAFQYILCYGSTMVYQFVKITLRISIHLMLRFNLNSSPYCSNECRFQYILCYGSTLTSQRKLDCVVEFQYILCYGSTESLEWEGFNKQHFNTSYVTVQQALDSHQGNFSVISIHLMLRFNVDCVVILRPTKVISIHLMLRFNSCTYAFYISHHIKQLLQSQRFLLFFPMTNTFSHKNQKHH